MKKISLLGSTGSIGKNTLKVAAHLKDEVEVVALAAGSNSELLEEQVKAFRPKLVALYDSERAAELQKRLPNTPVLAGDEGLLAVAAFEEAHLVMSAIAGTKGLAPTMAAIEAGKDVALANKEALVSGGALVMEAAKRKGVSILPVDSEHSAIFQCLQGEHPKNIRRIILTSSGGPFRIYTEEQLAKVTREEALAHPTWSMGPKVTIDSSTLMNKGLEVIEAYWLFGVRLDQIDVVIHPQSIIHSMVEFVDFSMMAQMGAPSMITPIQYAITYPDRHPGLLAPFNFAKHSRLEFFTPNRDKFRCLDLAYQAIQQKGSLPCYMNGANEVLVHRFLRGELSWLDIGRTLETLMQKHSIEQVTSLEDIFAIDILAREQAASISKY